MAKSKLVKSIKEIDKTVVSSYKNIEESIVGAYKKVEKEFMDSFLTRDGESVEDAKKRLVAEQQERDVATKADMERRTAEQKERVEASLEVSGNARKHK